MALRGIAASPGMGVGRAVVISSEHQHVRHHRIEDEDAEYEIERLRVAVERSRRELEDIRHRLGEEAPADYRLILDAHLMMHRDELLIEEEGQRTYLGFPGRVRMRSLVTARHRLSVYDGVPWGELYDLDADPHEAVRTMDADGDAAALAVVPDRVRDEVRDDGAEALGVGLELDLGVGVERDRDSGALGERAVKPDDLLAE